MGEGGDTRLHPLSEERNLGAHSKLLSKSPVQREIPAEGHQIGHQRSRSGIKVVVDQKKRGVACRVELPGHKLGLDQP